MSMQSASSFQRSLWLSPNQTGCRRAVNTYSMKGAKPRSAKIFSFLMKVTVCEWCVSYSSAYSSVMNTCSTSLSSAYFNLVDVRGT